MAYRTTLGPRGRGRVGVPRVSGHRTLGAPPPFNLPGGFPGGPGMLPGPIPGPGTSSAPGPTMAASIFPTSGLRWGDVVNVQGPFGAMMQGQVLVRFTGAPAQAIALQGPFGGSAQVPVGAESGAVTIEVNGRVVGSSFASITPAAPVLGEPRGRHAWHNAGGGSPLGGSMYHRDPDAYSRGAGAIAAVDAHKSARRRALEARARRVARARDVAMAAVTRGALGRIATDGEPGGGEGTAPGTGGGRPRLPVGGRVPTSSKYPKVPSRIQPPPVFPPAGQVNMGTYRPPILVAPPVRTVPAVGVSQPLVSSSGGGVAVSSPTTQIPEDLVGPDYSEFQPIEVEADTIAPAPAGPSKKTLLWVAAGIGALLLMSR